MAVAARQKFLKLPWNVHTTHLRQTCAPSGMSSMMNFDKYVQYHQFISSAKSYLQAYYGVEILDDLVNRLVQVEPDDRPTAKEALELWNQKRPPSRPHFFTTRIRRRDESYPEAVFNTSIHAINDSVHAVKAMAKLFSG